MNATSHFKAPAVLAGLLVLALAAAPIQAGDRQFLSVTLGSKHVGMEGRYNEVNPGLGYWLYSDKSASVYGAGCFRNSFETSSCYAGTGLSTPEYRPLHFIGYLGVVSGYDGIDQCPSGLCPMLGGAARMRFGNSLLSLDILPAYHREQTGAVVALQYMARLW